MLGKSAGTEATMGLLQVLLELSRMLFNQVFAQVWNHSSSEEQKGVTFACGHNMHMRTRYQNCPHVKHFPSEKSFGKRSSFNSPVSDASSALAKYITPMVSLGGEYGYIFYLVHFIFFNLLSGVSPGSKTRVSIKSRPKSIFSAAVDVTTSDLIVSKDMSDFSAGDTVFHSWAAGGSRQVRSTTPIVPPPLSSYQ